MGGFVMLFFCLFMIGLSLGAGVLGYLGIDGLKENAEHDSYINALCLILTVRRGMLRCEINL